MPTFRSDRRNSGIALIGDIPWGSHFCQFYRSAEELLDILVPFFKAGLESNELCVWITSAPLVAADAGRALEEAVDGYEDYKERGQIEIISLDQWRADGRTVAGMAERAVYEGFDGVRLAGAALQEEGERNFTCCDAEEIGRHNAIAVFGYARDRFDALGLMEVVKNHRFALVRNAGRWEVIESAEARTIKDALKRSGEKLQSLFRNMAEGFAYHRIVLDALGEPCDYIFLEVNDAFERLTGLRGEDIIGRRVRDVLPGLEQDETDWIGRYGRVALTGEPVRFESYSAPIGRWFSVSAFSPHKGYFAVTFSDITERKLAEEENLRLNEELKQHVIHLEAANRELEAFSYSVSHDLRAPLRSIDGFSRIILEDCLDRLDEEGRDSFRRICEATRRMGLLIDGLLSLSRISRSELARVKVDLSSMASEIAAHLMKSQPERKADFVIAEGLVAQGDDSLLYVALQNLLGNAWKFTRMRSRARIEFGMTEHDGGREYFVRDNGAGFDMAYVNKLFGPFQRLHSDEEFEGTGIGLATVQRIIHRHGGLIWAEAEVGKGATFYFTLS